MRRNKIKALIVCFFLALNSSSASASDARITDVSIGEVKAQYKIGDAVAVDISYAGTNVIIQSGHLRFISKGILSGTQNSPCIGTMDGTGWADAKYIEQYSRQDFGNVKPGVVRILVGVGNNCVKGVNDIYLESAQLFTSKGEKIWFRDQTKKFSLNVSNGLYVSEMKLENKQKSKFNLESFPSFISANEGAPYKMTLPTFTPEGILIEWGVFSTNNACSTISEYPDARSHRDLLINSVGECRIFASAQLANSTYEGFSFTKDVKVVPAAEKAAAEKAAAEKAAAEKAAAEKAAANARKSTIICVKGKVSGKVTGIKPKCPAGFKIKK